MMWIGTEKLLGLVVKVILLGAVGLAFFCYGVWQVSRLHIAPACGSFLVSYALFTSAKDMLKIKRSP
jgi:hypothetical protein